MQGKIKVLFIAGTGRNGSTLLGNILGQIEGFTNVGELLDIGLNFAPGRPPCGCGVPLEACDVWKGVLSEVFRTAEPGFVARMHRLRLVETLFPELPSLLLSPTTRKLEERLASTREDIERLYRAIQQVCKSRVIIDSSKQPIYLHILQSIDAIDLHVVHLIRDPRALAFAYQHRIEREGYVLHMSPPRAAFHWIRRNLAIELLSRGTERKPLRVRFKELIGNPQETVAKIVEFTNEIVSASPFDGERVVNLRPLHTVAGNPNRFVTGRIEIRNNEQWSSAMSPLSKTAVASATWPLLLRYGFPLRTWHSEHKQSGNAALAA